MKILKILAVLVLSFVFLVVVLIGLLFYVMAKMPAVPTNYTEKVETGGVLEAKYIKQGSYGVECMTRRVGKSDCSLSEGTLFLRKEISGCLVDEWNRRSGI